MTVVYIRGVQQWLTHTHCAVMTTSTLTSASATSHHRDPPAIPHTPPMPIPSSATVSLSRWRDCARQSVVSCAITVMTNFPRQVTLCCYTESQETRMMEIKRLSPWVSHKGMNDFTGKGPCGQDSPKVPFLCVGDKTQLFLMYTRTQSLYMRPGPTMLAV